MRRMILAVAVCAAAIDLPLGAPGAGPIDFYVDGLSGNDSSTCQSPNNGCRTIQGAIDRIPVVLDRDVAIHVAAGLYAESLILADRLAPKGHEIRLAGEGPGVRLIGLKQRPTGILIRSSPRVVLDSLEVEGFTEAGILVLQSEAVLVNTRVAWNLSHGIVCEYGNLVFETDALSRGVGLLNNSGSGLYASSCHVIFQGPATIVENGIGLLAEHGGLIDLGARPDVSVMNNPPAPSAGEPGGAGGGGLRRFPLPELDSSEAACQLVADCHGMIMGYERAQIGGPCACAGLDYGICRP